MSLPYRYVRGVMTGKDEACSLCGTRSVKLVVEHCHEHGMTRGVACQSCNSRLARLDAQLATATTAERFYLDNCPYCRAARGSDMSPLQVTRHLIELSRLLGIDTERVLNLLDSEVGSDLDSGSSQLTVVTPLSVRELSTEIHSIVRLINELGDGVTLKLVKQRFNLPHSTAARRLRRARQLHQQAGAASVFTS
jgi:hypothetical protein